MICARMAWSAAGSDAARMTHFDAHKAFLRSGRLDILKSGPMFDTAGRQVGALVVADVADIATMQAICADDPFAVHGVYDHIEFVEWRITTGRSF
jgi:uncharacterized protein YciI